MSAPAQDEAIAPPTVAVIGAGLGGLSAAVYLRRAGFRVRVYDAAPVGGKARTIEPTPGWRIEWGPHSFTSRAYALFDLAEVLGIGGRAVRLGKAARSRFLVRGGRLRGAPFGGGIKLGEWVGLVRGLFRRVEDVPGESVRAWVARRFGEAFAAGPLDAMMTGIWASDPATIDMDAAFPTVSELVRTEGTVFRALRELARTTRRLREAGVARASGTWGFPRGMGELADAARAWLGDDTFVATEVTGITQLPDGAYTLVTGGGPVVVDAVVLASEASAIARLLSGIAPDAAAALGEVRYAPLAVAHWTAPDAAFPIGFGFLAPEGEQRAVLGTIFVSDLFPDRAPAGQRAFATMIGGGRHPELARIDAAEAKRRVEAEHLALTGRPVSITGFHLVSHPTAVAPPGLGHAARMARIHGALPTGISVAGSWCGAGAMDDAIRAGREAAESIGSRASWGGGRAPRNAPQGREAADPEGAGNCTTESQRAQRRGTEARHSLLFLFLLALPPDLCVLCDSVVNLPCLSPTGQSQ